ncbi:hypothetical protein BJ165DRAFT_1523085 [Panaeolus papilionaceus]|nr:hypothetical protein BJ165DRAFT_1523085 [Panaeolus papilionaceus]
MILAPRALVHPFITSRALASQLVLGVLIQPHMIDHPDEYGYLAGGMQPEELDMLEVRTNETLQRLINHISGDALEGEKRSLVLQRHLGLEPIGELEKGLEGTIHAGHAELVQLGLGPDPSPADA